MHPILFHIPLPHRPLMLWWALALAAAAAIAYAVVFVDRVPLSTAEVAATFRVSPAALRGRFGELRARLDLTPGDVRYATRP